MHSQVSRCVRAESIKREVDEHCVLVQSDMDVVELWKCCSANC